MTIHQQIPLTFQLHRIWQPRIQSSNPNPHASTVSEIFLDTSPQCQSGVTIRNKARGRLRATSEPDLIHDPRASAQSIVLPIKSLKQLDINVSDTGFFSRQERMFISLDRCVLFFRAATNIQIEVKRPSDSLAHSALRTSAS